MAPGPGDTLHGPPGPSGSGAATTTFRLGLGFLACPLPQAMFPEPRPGLSCAGSLMKGPVPHACLVASPGSALGGVASGSMGRVDITPAGQAAIATITDGYGSPEKPAPWEVTATPKGDGGWALESQPELIWAGNQGPLRCPCKHDLHETPGLSAWGTGPG